MSTPEDTGMPNGDRRAQPPVSLDVIAYQVGSLQTALDRGLGSLERTVERGMADLRVEVAGLSARVGEMEKQWERVDTRVYALEQFRLEEEERQRVAAERAQQRAELAEVDQTQLRTMRWVAGGAVMFVAIGSFVVALLQLVGGH